MTNSHIAALGALCLLAGCQAAQPPRRDLNWLSSTPVPVRDVGWPAALETTSRVQPAAYAAATQPAPAPPLPAPHPPASARRGSENLPAAARWSLDDLEQMALAYNPSLSEARANVEALQGKWLQVGLPPNTVAGYSGQQIGSGGQAEQQGVFIGQEFVRGGKLRLARAVVDQEIVRAEQLWFAQQQRVLTDVRLGYYEVLIAQRRSEVTQRLVDIAGAAHDAAERLFKAMEVAQVDVIRSQGALQKAQLAHKIAGNRYAAAWSRLTAVLATPDLRPQPLAGDLEAVAERLDERELLQQLVIESPEVAAAAAAVERAEWAIEQAAAEAVPNLDVQAVVQSDNGTNSSNANLQVTMPIPWLNYNQGGIRQAEAELVAASHALARVELRLQQRLANVFQEYATAFDQVQDYSRADGILDNSRAALKLIQLAYELGEVDYLDLLAAQSDYSQTNLAYLEALGELWAAKVEIDGLLLKNSLQEGGTPR